MPAYVLVDTKLTDPEAYEEYKALARPLAEQHGAVYLARGGAMDVVEDELWQPTRLVLLQFPDMDSARAFLSSDAYQPVKAIRNANAECTTVIFEGV